MVLGGLKNHVAFSYRADEVVPLRLIHDSDSTASAAYTLATCDSIGIDRDQRGGYAVDRDAVWGRLGREGV